MHILLLEPDSVLADIYAQVFLDAGNTISYARTAEAAIREADNITPDIVLLEIQLAAHNGVAFLQEFRSYADWSSIPVILHTLISPRELHQYGAALQEMGVVAQLYKPQTTLRTLVNTVERYTTAVS